MSDHNAQLSPRVKQLVQDFALQPGNTPRSVEGLRTAIGRSPTLASQIDKAISGGLLRHLEILDVNANSGGEYHSEERVIKLPTGLLAKPATTSFILGHETQHALNAPAIARAYDRFARAIVHIAATTRDYTDAVDELIKVNRKDEASANLAGWNALADFVRRPHRRLEVDDVIDAAPDVALDFVDWNDGRPVIHRGLTPEPDLSFALSPPNLEAMAVTFVDKSADEVHLGPSGTSDYANYYATAAIGIAVWKHNQRNPGQLIRIDLARLGLSRRLIEENGLRLGVWQQPYIDGSTCPPTRGTFHDTGFAHRYIPFPPCGDGLEYRALDAARLAAIGFTGPATEAIRGTCVPAVASTPLRSAMGVHVSRAD